MDDTQSLAELIVTATTLPFIIILSILVLSLYRSMRKATASRRWPVTDGRIVSSDVKSHRSLDSNGTHTTIYEPAVAYEYTISGKRHQGDHLNFGAIDGTSSSSWAEEIVAKYSVGDSVQVYYNPAKVSESVLDHSGSSGGTPILMIILLAVELLLVGILVAAWTGKFN